jgi:nucleoside-diphosphate-sugar epimerase/uncharacterized membrane protein
MAQRRKPLVLITGASGRIGSKLIERLRAGYRIAAFDIRPAEGVDFYNADISKPESIGEALAMLKKDHGTKIAAVVHLAAFYDFTGEDDERYQTINVGGTRNLIDGLVDFAIERFVYTSTILVHEPGRPGDLTTEETPIAPRWAYPQSKVDAEEVIVEQAGDTPWTILRLAGVYDEEVAVPTLAQQIARVYELDFEAGVYAGDPSAGQSLLHTEDMVEAIAAVVDKRGALPRQQIVLVGEPGAASYAELQHRIGTLIHGGESWKPVPLPKPIAKFGAMLLNKAEPLIPDSIDQGERPFIRPFMVAMADDHYALDVSRARDELGWAPRHRILEELPAMIGRLKADPLGWYKANKVTPPHWMTAAREKHKSPEAVRTGHEDAVRRQHQRWLWAHWANVLLGLWLITSPPTLGYGDAAMTISDIASGVAIVLLALLSLDWRFALARFGVAAVALWVLFAPLVFWTPSAAAYLNATLVGGLALGLALAARPFPLVAPIATETGPDVPPGWDNSPSTFVQRAPIIGLAVIGFLISRVLTAYQLGHVQGVWEPFFAGAPDNPRNGTEEIITSEVSRAWPVPDAGLGALTYLLEIITGLVGSSRRWRTIPWMVLLFGVMIVPLGIVSVTFIIIQPIVLGAWCTLCLIAAAAMVIQIPYSVDELAATGQFLRRKAKQKGLVRAFIFGDTDEGTSRDRDDFEQPLREDIRRMNAGLGLPWTLALSMIIGLFLMTTRLTLGSEGAMANSDHLIGSLAIVVAATACAEVTRPVRLLNIALGAALAIMPFVLGAPLLQVVVSVVLGLALMALSLPRGRIAGSYGSWNRYLI